ncbi:EF-hand domain-containing protein [Marinobacter sp. 1Y8]
MKPKALILSIALASSLASPLALAGDYGGGSVTPQAERESNTHNPGTAQKQGSLSSSLFEQLDTDGNGVLSGDELNAYGDTAAGHQQQDKNQSSLKAHDANDDGTISRKEFEQTGEADH